MYNRKTFVLFAVLMATLSPLSHAQQSGAPGSLYTVPTCANTNAGPASTEVSTPVICQSPTDPNRIKDVAEARWEQGRRRIYIDSERWARLSLAARTFIYEHEWGHHVYGHTRTLAISGNVIASTTKQAQEEEADCYAAHTFAARGMAEQLKEVYVYLETLRPKPDERSVEARKATVRKCFENTLFKPAGARDASALSYLIKEAAKTTFNPKAQPEALLSYAARYRNGGKVPLQCTLTIASGHRLRDVPHEESNWRPFETTTFSFSLDGAARYSARGKFHWYRQENTMPSIQYPDPEESTEYVNCKFAEGWVAPPATARVSYSNAIERLMQTSKDDFKSLRGALRREEKETQSLLGLIDATECTIKNDSSSEPQLTCTLTGVNEQKQLDAQYDAVVKALKQVLTAEWEVEEETDSAGQKQFGATWKNDDYLNGPNIRIHVRVWDKERLIKEYGKYELIIIFEGRFKMQGVARIQ